MAQFIVTNTEDVGSGSLRQAIEDANALAGRDTIVFEDSLSGSRITLTSGQLTISDSLEVRGLGAENLAISGNNSSRVFNIFDGTNELIDVEIDSLTITEGEDFGFRGGGSGGGIANSENLTVSNSSIDNNFALDTGGGIANRGILNLKNSTVSQNTVTGGFLPLDGGGISNTGTARIENSTIANNEAGRTGGGIINFNGGTLEIVNSTISGNSVAEEVGGMPDERYIRAGAGIYNDNLNDSSTVTITSSIIASNFDNFTNSDLGGGVFTDRNAFFSSNGNNLIGNPGDAAGFSNGTNGDIVGTADNPIDPLLGNLQNNGGSTFTQALLTGSPAIDAGSNPSNLITDQRGGDFSRTIDGNNDGNSVTDIGAFEATSGGNSDPGNNNGELILGTSGKDSLVGGVGNDTLDGFEGKDTLRGGAGDDELIGSQGKDLIFGDEGNDLLAGNRGKDTLEGGDGNDTLFGDEGKDLLVGGSGNDILFGGGGQDSFALVSGQDADGIIDFQLGRDILLLDGLTFENIAIEQDNNNTNIIVADTRELIAVLIDTDSSNIGESNFALN